MTPLAEKLEGGGGRAMLPGRLALEGDVVDEGLEGVCPTDLSDEVDGVDAWMDPAEGGVGFGGVW